MPNFPSPRCAPLSRNRKPTGPLFSMSAKTIGPAKAVQGTVSVPGDKSISHRAVILGALSNRTCSVKNFLEADDCLCTLEALRAMGIQIDRDGPALEIHGKGLDGLQAPAKPIWCGNSGTTTRLLMGVFTGQPFEALEDHPVP